MQEREFWQLLEEVLGRSYGRALAHDQVLDRLNGLTAVEAFEMGEEPRVVWNVLCDQMNIPDSKRWGKDHNCLLYTSPSPRDSGRRRVEMHVLRPQWPIELAQMDDAVLR